jgi:hypothetical protein
MIDVLRNQWCNLNFKVNYVEIVGIPIFFLFYPYSIPLLTSVLGIQISGLYLADRKP